MLSVFILQTAGLFWWLALNSCNNAVQPLSPPRSVESNPAWSWRSWLMKTFVWLPTDEDTPWFPTNPGTWLLKSWPMRSGRIVTSSRELWLANLKNRESKWPWCCIYLYVILTEELSSSLIIQYIQKGDPSEAYPAKGSSTGRKVPYGPEPV